MSYVVTWLALLALLAATVASSLVHLATFNTLLGIAIACAKALLVAFVFIRLRDSGTSIRLVCLICADARGAVRAFEHRLHQAKRPALPPGHVHRAPALR